MALEQRENLSMPDYDYVFKVIELGDDGAKLTPMIDGVVREAVPFPPGMAAGQIYGCRVRGDDVTWFVKAEGGQWELYEEDS